MACSLFLLGGLLIVCPVLVADAATPGGTTPGGLTAIQKGIQSTAQGAQLPTTGGDLPTMIGAIISSVLALVGVILFGYMIYGGFRWMTAGGDAKAVTDAQAILKNAVIGIVIIALAYAITNYIIGALINAQSTTTGTPATIVK